MAGLFISLKGLLNNNDEKQALTNDSREIVPVNKAKLPSINNNIDNFKIHDDIKNLLWFGDGPMKNLTREQMASDKDEFTIAQGRIKISVFISTGDEPSLIYIGLPTDKPADESVIPRPPYFPSYRELTPEQRWIYAKLLTNPYNTDIDIGYVFILYYGLERHLLQGDFHSAFNVILKLRDVHKNKSFQSYSGNALVLTSLIKNKGEYIPIFLDSLDKEYEYNFYDDLLLLCYYSFNVPLLPKDIMRMSKTFGFTNTNYIKKNPDIFLECLAGVVGEKTSTESLDIKNYIKDGDIPKLKQFKTTMFANTSIVNNSIIIPLLSSNQNLNTEIKTMLETAHERAKTRLAEIRKSVSKK
jgi:hypothetical protein